MSAAHALLAALAVAAAGAGFARAEPTESIGSNFPTAPLDERVLYLAADPDRPATLQVTVLAPEGTGPFPVAVMNHGSSKPGEVPSQMPRYRASFEAYYFLSRGYAVVLPMQRGFAGSNGQNDFFRCDIDRFARQNAKDILAVIGDLASDRRLDTSRVVVAGQSMGGWNALAVGAAGSRSVKGVLNFNGGMRTSNCPEQERALINGAERLGRAVRVPTLWFYADNDKLFPPSVWREMYHSFTKAGGDAQLVDVGSVGKDGHAFAATGASLKLWTPAADAFLDRLGLPAALVYPQYMPTRPPPPSHFAAIDDVMAVPYLNDAARAIYRKFLSEPLPRAVVLSPRGLSQHSDGFDPLGDSMRDCAARFTGCAPYAVDNDVVWVPPAERPAAAPRVATATVAAGSTATLGFAYSVNPDCTSRGLMKIRVTQTPAHGAVQVTPRDGFPRFPPASPFAACNLKKVPGICITYTPAPGFTGIDDLIFEETTPQNQVHSVVFAITVK